MADTSRRSAQRLRPDRGGLLGWAPSVPSYTRPPRGPPWRAMRGSG